MFGLCTRGTSMQERSHAHSEGAANTGPVHPGTAARCRTISGLGLLTLAVGLCPGILCSIPASPDAEPLTHRVIDLRPAEADDSQDPADAIESPSTTSDPSVAVASATSDDEALTDSEEPVTAPTAEAGPNQFVEAGTRVRLDASGSRYADRPGTWFAWRQRLGPSVTLDRTDIMQPTFTAPTPASGRTVLFFEVTVGRPFGGIGTDTVSVTVATDVPALTLTPAHLAFTDEVSLQSFRMDSEMDDAFVVKPGADWLYATPSRGSVGPQGSVDVAVTVDRDLLAAGTHSTSIRVETDSGRFAEVSVTVTVNDPLGSDLPAGVAANQAIPERWLFSHPSWLRWWVLTNLENHPDEPRLITGVFCVFLESATGIDSLVWLDEVRTRCRNLGLDFVFAIRHSWSSEAEMALAFDPAWQQAAVDILRASGEAAVMVDGESYYDEGLRYPTGVHIPLLESATTVWRELGPKRMFGYPIGQAGSYHTRAILEHARQGGATPYALAVSTYLPLQHANLEQHIAEMNATFQAESLLYVPGFFLRFARNEKVMKAAAPIGRAWFFGLGGLTAPDDMRHFGSPDWQPRPE